MRYVEPGSIEEVLEYLSAGDEARCLAGGQTLVAMMNADLVEPEVLIGLRRLPALAGIDTGEEGVRIGAMTTHATIAADERLGGAAGVVRHAAGQIAHPAIRNAGTIGGSLCHGDPQADFPGAVVAADARMECTGPEGRRTIAATDFFLDYFETALAPGELLTAVLIPAGPPGAAGHHLKFTRVEGDYATVSVSVVLAMDGETCTHARVAVGSVGPVPLHLDEADAALTGSRLLEEDIARAGELLAGAANPIDDVRGSSGYRRQLVPGLLGRAVAAAKEKINV